MKFTVEKNDNLLWAKKKDLKGIQSIAKEVASSLLEVAPPFCLWLQGEIGAGKTTFTKALFAELGLNPNFPVTSPTYTYLLEYKIGDSWYAHMDFYRFSEGVGFEEEELLGARDYAGFILEWPSNVQLPKTMAASHKLEIKCHDEKERNYTFYHSLRV